MVPTIPYANLDVHCGVKHSAGSKSQHSAAGMGTEGHLDPELFTAEWSGHIGWGTYTRNLLYSSECPWTLQPARGLRVVDMQRLDSIGMLGPVLLQDPDILVMEGDVAMLGRWIQGQFPPG